MIIRTYMMAAAVMVALLFVSATARAQDVDTDLVAHWTFDNDSGSTITDSSGNNNDGTWVDGGDNNISGEIVQGVNGRGLRFAADTNIQASFFPTGASAPYTVAIWLKPYSIGTPGQIAIWRAGPDSPTCQNGPKLRKTFESNNYNLDADNQCSGTAGTSQYVYDDSWYHVVVVYDGTNIALYLNGVLQQSIASNYSGTDPQAAAFR
ncbi:MAG: LamG-like jellyroll fold domain-containing protein, partial [Pseudomonadota bacterium]|nr:LamG-like jellyroll fold domain-containing protein [Pseudomonadota bacterium]